MDATRIEEVVGEFVTLRRRGASMIGLCPFHNEKTPSFNVHPARNVFKCFGCGKAGDAISFLRESEQLSYIEAIKWLAKKYNIQIEEIERSPEQMAEMQAAESLFIVNDFAQKHFEHQLFHTEEGKQIALSYFKNRGLREETIRIFGLGYAPDQRDLLLRSARNAGHALDLLKKNGLCSQDGTRDFFRARVMFPIHSLSGKVAAFAGRTFSADKTVPKYVNSPETEIYHKSKVLYGMYHAKKAMRQQNECILVEGYMDVISLYQAGIQNAVASSGTSLTEGQVQLIRRNAENLTILYDGDPAGIKAALRGLDIALEQDLNVRIALLPSGEDPDSYAQKEGGVALRTYISEHAHDFIVFKAQLLSDEAKGDPIRKSALVKDIVSSIAKIPDPIKRSVYIKTCSGLLQVDEDALNAETNRLLTNQIKKKDQKARNQPGAASDSAPPDQGDFGWPDQEYPNASETGDLPDAPAVAPSGRAEKTRHEFQEKDLVRILVEHGHQWLEKENTTVAEYVLADIEDSIGSFEHRMYAKIVQTCYELLLRGEKLSKNYFLHHDDPEITSTAVDLVTSPYEMSENWILKWNYPLQNQKPPELNFQEDARQVLDRFKLDKLKKMCDINADRIKTAAQNGQEEDMFRFMKIHQKLNETRNAIAERLGTVVLR
jgi:DNA primase